MYFGPFIARSLPFNQMAMRNRYTLRGVPLPFAFLFLTTFAIGQVPVTADPVNRWERPITIVPDQFRVNDVDFPAHTITVHGTDANRLLDWWRNDMSAQSRDISGRRPTIARGVMIPELSEMPVNVMAETTRDRRADHSKLTIAFAENDSTPLMDDGRQEQYVHSLAVRYNQASIQDKIADKRKELERAQRRSDRAGSNEQRTQTRMQRSQDRLEQARLRREREQAAMAEIEGEVMGLERRHEITSTERDMRRLLRARRSLARKQGDVLKLQEREASLQADINKYRAQLPDHDRDVKERSVEVERLEQEIDQLDATRQSLEEQ
jgi:hypothetical protein